MKDEYWDSTQQAKEWPTDHYDTYQERKFKIQSRLKGMYFVEVVDLAGCSWCEELADLTEQPPIREAVYVCQWCKTEIEVKDKKK